MKGYILIGKDGTLLPNRYGRYEIYPDTMSDFDKLQVGGTADWVELRECKINILQNN